MELVQHDVVKAHVTIEDRKWAHFHQRFVFLFFSFFNLNKNIIIATASQNEPCNLSYSTPRVILVHLVKFYNRAPLIGGTRLDYLLLLQVHVVKGGNPWNTQIIQEIIISQNCYQSHSICITFINKKSIKTYSYEAY